MTEPEPLTPRPAATVMLVRDTAEGIKVFLMRRHRGMEFVAGVTVFPGGGVDDRDRGVFPPGRSAPAPEGGVFPPGRSAPAPEGGVFPPGRSAPAPEGGVFPPGRSAPAPEGGVFPPGRSAPAPQEADVAWYGPEPSWWADRLGVDVELAEALVCAAARETFEESGVLFAGPAGSPDEIVADASVYRDARKALDAKTLSFGEFLRNEKLVLRADLLRPWANWITPKEERTRRYDTYFFVGALPDGQRADGDNTETDQAGWATPQSALDDFGAGRSFLLPPTWTQLDALNGRTVGEVLAVERKIVAIEPHLAVSEGNWEIEFFNSERYNEARNRRAPAGYTGSDSGLGGTGEAIGERPR